MLELGRPGKLGGKGFYEYADGKRTGLWPGLREAFGSEFEAYARRVPALLPLPR